MKTIKDPVHGYIQVPTSLLPLLDSPKVQRLRYVRQLGFSYFVYPGAHHTRFEHSLGTMHLAGMVADQLNLSGEDNLLVMAAGLLHDIGHGPYSHAVEGVAQEVINWHHADLNTILKTDLFERILVKIGLDPDEVVSLISGTHQLAGIIHGELDVDRMDYLLRDAHYTGVPYGTVDAMRLIRAMRMMDGNIILHDSGVQAAESLLIARTLMRPSVYYHHVSRIAEKMFCSAVWQYIKPDPALMIHNLLIQDDAACMQSLLHSEDPLVHGIAEDLYYRRLYKRVMYVGRNEVWQEARHPEESFRREIELAGSIADQAGVLPHEVLVDIPAFPHDIVIDVLVQEGGVQVPLEQISPLVTTLNETRRSQWRLGVYAPRGLTEKVREAAREVLKIKPQTRQSTLASLRSDSA